MIMAIPFSSAVGVVSEYWGGPTEKPLYVNPGETKEAIFTLQNMVGDAELTFKATIIEGQEWARLANPDQVYLVPAQSSDVKVKVLVTIPADTPIGTSQRIGVSFSQVTETDSGQFQFGSAFDKYFYVTIPAPTAAESSSNNTMLIGIIAGVILVAAIIWIVARKKSA